METLLKKLDHIGIAVRDVDEALRAYGQGLGMAVTHREHVATEGADVAFLPIGDTRLELLQPRGPEGVLGKFLDKRGPGVHHLCFEVDDIRAALGRLAAAGVPLVDREPRPGAEGCLVAFLHPKGTGGVLIELSEHPRRAAAGPSSAPAPAGADDEDPWDVRRGSVVVAYLHTPREKVWGQVLKLSPLGLAIRGIDLSAFEDWVNEVASGREEMTMGLAALFLPMHRVEKIELDATVGAARSCTSIFEDRTHMRVLDYLKGAPRSNG